MRLVLRGVRGIICFLLASWRRGERRLANANVRDDCQRHRERSNVGCCRRFRRMSSRFHRELPSIVMHRYGMRSIGPVVVIHAQLRVEAHEWRQKDPHTQIDHTNTDENGLFCFGNHTDTNKKKSKDCGKTTEDHTGRSHSMVVRSGIKTERRNMCIS